MVELVVEDERSDRETWCRHSGDEQRHERIDRTDVIERQELDISELLGLLGGGARGAGVAELAGLQSEPERADHRGAG